MTKTRSRVKKPSVAKQVKTIKALQHIVKKPFKYGDRKYDPGHVFEPQGGKYDDKLIKSHCYSEEIEMKVTTGVEDEQND